MAAKGKTATKGKAKAYIPHSKCKICISHSFEVSNSQELPVNANANAHNPKVVVRAVNKKSLADGSAVRNAAKEVST